MQASQFDGAGEAQPIGHRGRDKLGIGVGSRDARHHFGRAQHGMVTALGFQWHGVAKDCGQRLGMRTGGDNCGVRGHVSFSGLHGAQSIAIQPEAGGRAAQQRAAIALHGLRQSSDKAAGIEAVPITGDQLAAE